MKEEIKYLVFDIESVPDSRLIKEVKYPGTDLTENDAVAKFQEEILTNSDGATLFIPVTFQYPISICTAKVREDFTLADICLLDEPEYRPSEMVKIFWNDLENNYKDISLVTFNGRGFDIPLLELMAFRYGYSAKKHLKDKFGTRYRFGTKHIDVHDWLSNFNAIRMNGGLNLLAKSLGMPGKMDAKGEEVYDMFLEGKLKEINDYCTHDVLDTYFVFLRTRVMLGELTIAREQQVVKQAMDFLEANKEKRPAFDIYLKNCKGWSPWP
ncbi:MAG: ribonuclease H-like domain-containing protein [Spirochaetes bacterium]|nr:ribonuclease H-like domain-containing protein [Spirochaetota bacterium]